MTELEKCMAGECYNCHDKIFLDFKSRATKLLKKYNALEYEQKEEKENILKGAIWKKSVQRYQLHYRFSAIMGGIFMWEIMYLSI